MIGSRKDTEISVASTQQESSRTTSPMHHHAKKVSVFSVAQSKAFKKCTLREAQDHIKRSTTSEPPLVPRVFLHARELGASTDAIELLSKVRRAPRLSARPRQLLQQLIHAARTPRTRAPVPCRRARSSLHNPRERMGKGRRARVVCMVRALLRRRRSSWVGLAGHSPKGDCSRRQLSSSVAPFQADARAPATE
jgi:hypothetical protein